jgi:cyclophilin family peptidyl-prolyl cis-trans isomerase
LPTEYRPLKSKPQELKKFVRLIGWVFWSSEKLYDWVEFGKSFYEFRLEAGDFDQDWDNCGHGKPFRWANRDEEESREVQSMYRKRNHAVLVEND